MKNLTTLGKILRIVAIILMTLTAAFTILGGAGTSCVAFAPNNPSWAEMGGKLAPYQWLYILFVLATLAFGVMGARAVVLLIRGRANAYRYSLIALIGGAVVGIIHILVSRSLRGSSMPVDMVVYTTILTLAYFLILRIPALWQKVGFDQPASANTAGTTGGLAAILAGVLALTVHLWAGPTHTWNGVNWADAWHPTLTVAGWGLVLLGIGLLAWSMGLAFGRSSLANGKA
ncbi:MAG TPA: hypothetical protein PKM21_07750 [Anaerolineales bacterium]|nr:hypothetical protein [Anaerolineales bacterium]